MTRWQDARYVGAHFGRSLATVYICIGWAVGATWPLWVFFLYLAEGVIE